MKPNTARNRRSAVVLVLVLVLALVLTSCGSGDVDEESSDPTVPASSGSPTSAPPDAVDEPDETEPPEADGEPAEEAWADLFPEITLDPTESGPRPILSWSEIEGTALYQLTVLDADGVPYWAWSGTETAVPLGGMDNPDAIGAWVFEDLSWMVVARDASGAPLGMSRREALRP